MPLANVTTPALRRQYAIAPERAFSSSPAALKRITVSEDGMPAGPDFSPMDTNETVTLTFDFGPWLGSGVSISSVSAVTAAAYFGTDAEASSRLVDVPSRGASPSTGAANGAVLQQFGNSPVAGVTYRIDVLALTSDNQTLNLYAHIAAQAPN